ncbi:hypothetical protein HELRODRAFT_160051 [Helobdella robusta]|uniref:Uncharacterized protein n=1 Tax=Helobdella robusta TaxID=6412 RepID=T1EPQ1_HELRO|nr:hypothetical protein HELRODRAFT_160051 [Helobdella robusta]ESO05952.1 hypothetical protein HELRODRAFT_160051 [Helobdella robusta]
MGVMCSQKYNKAAQLIQKDYKVLISNRLMINMTKEAAAIKIQKVWRGYQDRKLLKQKKKALVQPENINEINDVLNEEEEKKLSEAAIKITAAFVGTAERRSRIESISKENLTLFSRILKIL